MKTRFLGGSGLEVSVLGFGAMTFGSAGAFTRIGDLTVEDARELVELCLEAGVTLFDTADIYSLGQSEEILGQTLGQRRKEVVLATKVFGRMGPGTHDVGLSRRHIMSACDDSLRRLNTDWIDVYQVHGFDALTPVDETLRALDDLVRAGKVRYVGCSNHCGWQLMKALGRADAIGAARYVSQQIQYSLIVRDAEHELIPAGLDQRVGALIWSPLAQGYLSAKYRQAGTGRLDLNAMRPLFDDPQGRETVEALAEIADAREGTSPSQVALAWLLRKPGVTSVLIGARNAMQLRDNLGAAALTLSDEEMCRLDAVSARPVPYPQSHQRRSHPDRNPPADNLPI